MTVIWKLQKIENLAYRSARGLGFLFVVVYMWYVKCRTNVQCVHVLCERGQGLLNELQFLVWLSCQWLWRIHDVPCSTGLAFIFFFQLASLVDLYQRVLWQIYLIERLNCDLHTQTLLALMSCADSCRACQYNDFLFSTRTRHTHKRVLKKKTKNSCGGGWALQYN